MKFLENGTRPQPPTSRKSVCPSSIWEQFLFEKNVVLCVCVCRHTLLRIRFICRICTCIYVYTSSRKFCVFQIGVYTLVLLHIVDAYLQYRNMCAIRRCVCTLNSNIFEFMIHVRVRFCCWHKYACIRVYIYLILCVCIHASDPHRYTAIHCNTLQHAATRCNTLQHTATYCNILQHTATYCNILQHTVYTCTYIYLHVCMYTRIRSTPRHCNTLQHAASRCNILQHTATHYNILQHTATHYSTLQHTATHYSIL